ncbi:MAG: DsbA family protein [Rickettsia endosymbiont of Bryobia graminum]|nr:DsbA family protein [Rickettsia endosymbiont of Bryobia graminum]
MRFFIVILISLFLLACSEENNTKETISDEEVIQNFISDLDNNKAPANNSDEHDDITISENTHNNTDENNITTEVKTEISDKPNFKINKNDIVLGNPDSKVVLIEYYSPTCPHCAYFNKAVLPELKKKYVVTNKIAYVTREFISNKQDLDAAILQRCTTSKDSFLKFQSVILEQQDKWAGSAKYRSLLTNIGQIGGVSSESFEKCLKDDKLAKILLENTNFISQSPKFIGTPAFFINGEPVSEGYSLDILSKKIDKALEEVNPTNEI